MRKSPRFLTSFVMTLLMLALCQCYRPIKLDRRISLKPGDKIPYGAKVAYDGLSWLFPNSTISSNDKPLSNLPSSDGKRVYLIIGDEIDPSSGDINSLLDFVGQGNHVFVSARRFGDSLQHTLGVKALAGFISFGPMDSLTVSVRQPVTGDSLNYSYPGDAFDGWVDRYDPQYTTVLGRDHRGRPNFIRFNYKGGGTLYLHFAPLAFSNFFLLHKQNIGYYEDAFSYLPSTVQEVIWDRYYSGLSAHGRSRSALGWLLSQPGLAWAFWLFLLLILLIYLIDSKRRQRVVPVILPLQNTSLDFVRTIGRLYFQRRDNHNLANKMVTHFQDLVRTRYNLTATALDDELVTRLAYRTGYPREALSALVEYMRELPSKAYVPDGELMDFHRQLEAFYKIA